MRKRQRTEFRTSTSKAGPGRITRVNTVTYTTQQSYTYHRTCTAVYPRGNMVTRQVRINTAPPLGPGTSFQAEFLHHSKRMAHTAKTWLRKDLDDTFPYLLVQQMHRSHDVCTFPIVEQQKQPRNSSEGLCYHGCCMVPTRVPGYKARSVSLLCCAWW